MVMDSGASLTAQFTANRLEKLTKRTCSMFGESRAILLARMP